jgi:hypothetical protein
MAMGGTFLAIVSPSGPLSPTSRYWRMMAHLLGEITVLSVQPNVFERLALQSRDKDDRRTKGMNLTSMGLKGFAMRPIVDE